MCNVPSMYIPSVHLYNINSSKTSFSNLCILVQSLAMNQSWFLESVCLVNISDKTKMEMRESMAKALNLHLLILNCMQAHGTACILWNCIQDPRTVCKLRDRM